MSKIVNAQETSFDKENDNIYLTTKLSNAMIWLNKCNKIYAFCH